MVRPPAYPMAYPQPGPMGYPSGPMQPPMPAPYAPAYPPMPGYYGAPVYYPPLNSHMAPNIPVTYVPVVRPAPPAAKPPAPPPEPEPVVIDEPPVPRPVKRPVPKPELEEIEPEVVESPAPSSRKTAVKERPAKAQPQTFAEEAGEKVGQWVTRYLQENPQWEAKLKNLDLNNLDVESLLKNGLAGGDFAKITDSLGDIRNTFQQSWMSRMAIKYLAKPLLHVLPPEVQPFASQAIQWLSTKPEVK